MHAAGRSGAGLGALLLVLLLAPLAGAEEEPNAMHRVSFQVERSREVANDWVTAVVGITDEDPDAAALADRINRTMTWALERARREAGAKAQSAGYHTYPVHEKGRLRRWRASQALALEAGDAQAVSRLAGELQERLQLRSLDFSVSPETRRRVEDELIADVLAAFQARARLVQQQLGASSYEIVKVSLETGGPPFAPRQRALGAAMAEAAVAPPAVEAGTTRIEVRASATVELD